MEENTRKQNHYFRNTFLFIPFVLLALFISDRFLLQSVDMTLLKKQRSEYLSNLDKDSPIEIGVVWPLFLEEGDNYFKEGVLFALKTLNKDKLLGRKIEAIFRDDEGEIEKAKVIASEFATNKNIVAVIAHDDITLAIPASITYEYSGIIMISPAVSSPNFTKINFDYIFRNTPSDIIIGQELAVMAKRLNFKKIAVVNSRETYAESLSEVFIAQSLKSNLDVIYNKKYNKGEAEFLKILNTLSPRSNYSIDYDAIFVAGNAKDVSRLISKAREKGIYAPFITGDLLDSPELLKIGKDAENTIVATIYNSELISEELQDFKIKFKKEYNILPDTWAIQGYDAMMLLAEAIKNAQSLNPSLIASQLKYMNNFKSITGTYSLTPKGDTLNKKVYFKVVKNKKFEYINIE